MNVEIDTGGSQHQGKQKFESCSLGHVDPLNAGGDHLLFWRVLFRFHIICGDMNSC